MRKIRECRRECWSVRAGAGVLERACWSGRAGAGVLERRIEAARLKIEGLVERENNKKYLQQHS